MRHILVPSKALADDLRGQLADGADFAALAKKHSTDSSTDIGGELTIRKGEAVPQFEKVAFALKVNELSKPVKTRFGWHIIQALGPLKASKPTPLASVRQTIRDTLIGQEPSDTSRSGSRTSSRSTRTKSSTPGLRAPGTSPAAGTTETG